MNHKRIIGALFLCLFIGTASAAEPTRAPADVPGWEGTRWGMTAPEIEPVLGDALKHLPGRREYGGSYADRAINTSLGPVRFAAFPQMRAGSDRLRQVLLERRGAGVSPRAFQAALQALQAKYGPPTETCTRPLGSKEATVTAEIWRFPTTTIHAAYTDFYTRSIFFEDPNRDPDPLVPYIEKRRNNARFLPRRITVRFHASDDRALGDGCDGTKD